jgi:hypothetical protein
MYRALSELPVTDLAHFCHKKVSRTTTDQKRGEESRKDGHTSSDNFQRFPVFTSALMGMLLTV